MGEHVFLGPADGILDENWLKESVFSVARSVVYHCLHVSPGDAWNGLEFIRPCRFPGNVL